MERIKAKHPKKPIFSNLSYFPTLKIVKISLHKAVLYCLLYKCNINLAYMFLSEPKRVSFSALTPRMGFESTLRHLTSILAGQITPCINLSRFIQLESKITIDRNLYIIIGDDYT